MPKSYFVALYKTVQFLYLGKVFLAIQKVALLNVLGQFLWVFLYICLFEKFRMLMSK